MTYPVENYDAFIDRLACLPDEALLEASLPDDDVRESGYEDEDESVLGGRDTDPVAPTTRARQPYDLFKRKEAS
jgi:hypothetical protein